MIFSTMDRTEHKHSRPPVGPDLSRESLPEKDSSFPAVPVGGDPQVHREDFHLVVNSILTAIKADKVASKITDLDELVTHLDAQHSSLSDYVSDPEEKTRVWHGLIAGLNNYWYKGHGNNSPLARDINKNPIIKDLNDHEKGSWENRRRLFRLIIKHLPEDIGLKELRSFTRQYFLFLLPGQNSQEWAHTLFSRYMEEHGEDYVRKIGPGASRLVDDYFAKQDKYLLEIGKIELAVPFPKNGFSLKYAEMLVECNEQCKGSSGIGLARSHRRTTCHNVGRILSLNTEKGESVTVEVNGEQNRSIAEKAVAIIRNASTDEYTASDRYETEMVQKLTLSAGLEDKADFMVSINGCATAKNAASSLDRISLFIAYVTAKDKIYSRGGPRRWEHFERRTICVAEHYDGVRSGGVVELPSIKTERSFDEGNQSKYPPLFRGTYSLHSVYGHFLRIDPPVNKDNYCLAKGIDPESYPEAIVKDYLALLKSFGDISAEDYRKGWTSGTKFSEDPPPLDNITGSPLLVINDDLREIFEKQGLIFSKEVTLDQAIQIINKSVTDFSALERTGKLPPKKQLKGPAREVMIGRKEGLHLKLAGLIVEAVSKYTETDISITYRGKTVSAKEIMELPLLAAGKGKKVIVQAEGKNESKALETVCSLLEAE